MNPTMDPPQAPQQLVAPPSMPTMGQSMPNMGQATGKKRWLMIGGIIVVVIVLLLGLGWWQMNAAKKNYEKAATAYEQTVKTAFMYYHDSTDVAGHVSDITKKFDDAISAKPKQPKVWGLKVSVPSDQTKHVDELASDLRSLRTDFKNQHDFNIYGTKVLDIMNSASVTISTPTDMRNAQPKFKQAITDLKALKVPAGMENFHTARVQAYQDVSDDIDDALQALSANDSASYTSAVQKLALDAKNISTNAVANEFSNSYNSYLAKLTQSYDKLATLLNIKD